MAPRVFVLSVLAVALAGCSAPQGEATAPSRPAEAEDQSMTAVQAIPGGTGAEQQIQSTYSEAFEQCWRDGATPAIRKACVESEVNQQQARLIAAEAEAESSLVGAELEAHRLRSQKLREEIDSACKARPEATEAEQLDAAYCVMFRTAQAAEEREIANELEQEVLP